MRWHDMSWHKISCWHDMSWHGMTQDFMLTWHVMTWHDMAWHGMTWHDIAWHGMTLHDMAWHKISCWHDKVTWHVMTFHDTMGWHIIMMWQHVQMQACHHGIQQKHNMTRTLPVFHAGVGTFSDQNQMTHVHASGHSNRPLMKTALATRVPTWGKGAAVAIPRLDWSKTLASAKCIEFPRSPITPSPWARQTCCHWCGQTEPPAGQQSTPAPWQTAKENWRCITLGWSHHCA